MAQNEIFNSKNSIIESILRIVNIIILIISLIFGFVYLLMGNYVCGAIILISSLIIDIFILRKSSMERIKNLCPSPFMEMISPIIIYLMLPIVFFSIFMIGISFNSDSNTSADPDYVAKAYAESVLKNNLKNPQSLQVHSTKITVDFEYDNYHFYNITIDYSAQNGFGGYNRDNYDVLVKVSKSTNIASKASLDEYGDAIKNYLNENYSK